ncbi:MAG: SDR family NAD(P)-dependent oxidoreductase [Betaproteobacteria bacterium]|nr:SDR family NAD(P)-dependent oxidoreductase [Betaproteobacteria bacterium]
MALPRQFRRLRLGLIGFGDVARRSLELCLSRPSQKHGPRLIVVGRAASRRLPPKLHPAFFAGRHRALALDLDQQKSVQRMVRILQAAIVYLPTAEPDPSQAAASGRDRRARALACGLRAGQYAMPLVYLSTTGVYGNYQGAEVSETSRCQTRQPRSLRRLDAERALRPLGAHVLRVPGIYDSNQRLPTSRIAARQPALRQEEDVFTNHIHADDLARIALTALFRGRPGRITNAVDDTEMKMADYFDAVADALGLTRPPRVSREDMKSLAAQGAVHPMMMGFLAESRRVKSARIGRELRISLQYPTVDHTLREVSARLNRPS